jgi:hypothetical protein
MQYPAVVELVRSPLNARLAAAMADFVLDEVFPSVAVLTDCLAIELISVINSVDEICPIAKLSWRTRRRV